jgi:hypothetical protein
MDVTESKIFEGRISRSELEYRLNFPYFDIPESEIIEKDSNELKYIKNHIINTFSRYINGTKITAWKWQKTIGTLSDSGNSGGHGTSLLKIESNLMSKGNNSICDLLKAEKERQESISYANVFNIELKKIQDQLEVLNNDLEESCEPVQLQIGKILEFKKVLLDFILITVPGRTFLNSI